MSANAKNVTGKTFTLREIELLFMAEIDKEDMLSVAVSSDSSSLKMLSQVGIRDSFTLKMYESLKLIDGDDNSTTATKEETEAEVISQREEGNEYYEVDDIAWKELDCRCKHNNVSPSPQLSTGRTGVRRGMQSSAAEALAVATRAA